MWISDCGLTSGNTNSVEDGAASAPSAKVARSPASQNPWSPVALLVAWTQPAAPAAGNNSLASLEICPRAGTVSVAVACEPPPSPYSVNVTAALGAPGLTRANPIVRDSCGWTTRGKLSVDWLQQTSGSEIIAARARSVVFIESEYRSDSLGAEVKNANKLQIWGRKRHPLRL